MNKFQNALNFIPWLKSRLRNFTGALIWIKEKWVDSKAVIAFVIYCFNGYSNLREEYGRERERERGKMDETLHYMWTGEPAYSCLDLAYKLFLLGIIVTRNVDFKITWRCYMYQVCVIIFIKSRKLILFYYSNMFLAIAQKYLVILLIISLLSFFFPNVGWDGRVGPNISSLLLFGV
jgi:hypothetical protein